MATAQLLELTHGVGDTVKSVLDGTWWVIFSCCFLLERLCGQMEKIQKQLCNYWRTTLAR
jgi:hypothetical protein